MVIQQNPAPTPRVSYVGGVLTPSVRYVLIKQQKEEGVRVDYSDLPIPKPPKRVKKKPKQMRKVSKKRQAESLQYKQWQQDVIERDGGLCARCKLDAREYPPHHLLPKGKYPDYATDVKNGLTLCVPCHSMFHNFPEWAVDWLKKHRPEQYKYLYPDRSKDD